MLNTKARFFFFSSALLTSLQDCFLISSHTIIQSGNGYFDPRVSIFVLESCSLAPEIVAF